MPYSVYLHNGVIKQPNSSFHILLPHNSHCIVTGVIFYQLLLKGNISWMV